MNATPVAERFRQEIDALVQEGRELLDNVRDRNPAEVILGFSQRYQKWYARGLAVVRTLAPDRLEEFRRLYQRDEKRKVVDAGSHSIAEYMQGFGAPTRGYSEVPTFDVKTATYVKVNTQVDVIASTASRLDDILSSIRGVLQADLFDSELGAARELAKNGHLRAAGAVAGVVLEGHLGEMCSSHGITVSKKEPTIGDYNDLLKQNEVLDVPQWRLVQRLADLRNLCTHKKSREPTADEVLELVGGVDKAVKTLA